jgi:single-strand DNA-binding protein
MANFNKVLLVGNLTRDPELKSTPSNQSVAQIGLAVNRNYQTKEGEKREETTFVDCEAWGRTAEVMCQYLAKGRPVLVEGRLKLDQWQDKDGNNRSKLKVVIENFQFLGGRGEGGQGGGGGGQANYASSGNASSGNTGSGNAGSGSAGSENAGSSSPQGGGRPSDDPIPF